ncbi:GNAT family N-acetyltransferase [Aequorivita marina]|uniref:GNAT family N-acetyltransferase n=1 Tax=Aequorivita marina TaxID=3073654 RepID=UPI0028760127|nr:GNAT family N-acetyltransferase [Aequorivita sp. S2608]MDS1298884.1 GNAT family N-acetyltransferase [Aequorivita sp. S2608]
MIQLAKPSDLDQILAITKACGKKLNSDGIFQWSDTYPNKSIFQKDIENCTLYVFISDKIIVGCIVISTEMDPEYKTVKWLTKTTKHYYIHRLAVHPNYQGKGIARSLMHFAEGLAIENNIASVRLDTFSKNLRNQKFYEARGYQRLERIYFSNQSEFPFYCYELPVSQIAS